MKAMLNKLEPLMIMPINDSFGLRGMLLVSSMEKVAI